MMRTFEEPHADRSSHRLSRSPRAGRRTCAAGHILQVIGVTRVTATAIATFVLEWVVALALIAAFSFANETWGSPKSDALRQVVAYACLASVVGASLLVLLTIPVTLGRRLDANVWAALAAAGILTGITAYWLLQIVSITNDCTVGVSVPYNWIHTCSHSE
jgi:F0F1-type ATP synthase membrane subunit a